MSVIIFLLVLFVLILVHEWGHFIAAKKTGMRVDEFGIGFPPKLYGVKKGETEYTFNALPIGGFVRIFGENPDAVEESDKADLSRAFGSRPLWAQAVVLVAGVTMNVIFAWLLFFTTFMVGVPTVVEDGSASENTSLYISGVLPNGPLHEKVKAGSQILSVESGVSKLENLSPATFTEFIQSHADEDITIVSKIGDEQSELVVRPVRGILDGFKDKPAVGVSLALVENQKSSLLEAISAATNATYSGLVNITVGLFTLIAQAVQGTADFSQVAGPVGIVGLVGDAASFGLTSLLTFTAVISLNLAVINMLPVPALDGGRLLFVAYEAVVRRPVNPVFAGRVNLVGFALLMLLMVVVTYNDIARLIGF